MTLSIASNKKNCSRQTSVNAESIRSHNSVKVYLSLIVFRDARGNSGAKVRWERGEGFASRSTFFESVVWFACEMGERLEKGETRGKGKKNREDRESRRLPTVCGMSQEWI